jgi:hypothetical protein
MVGVDDERMHAVSTERCSGSESSSPTYTVDKNVLTSSRWLAEFLTQ